MITGGLSRLDFHHQSRNSPATRFLFDGPNDLKIAGSAVSVRLDPNAMNQGRVDLIGNRLRASDLGNGRRGSRSVRPFDRFA